LILKYKKICCWL